jgi:MFS family permease
MTHPKKLHTGKFTINRVIWLLTCSDIFSWGLYMSLSAIVAIYLSEKLGKNVVEIIGIGTAVYYFSKGIFQIPIGIITDKIKKDRDDILFLLAGNLFMGAPFIFYPLITNAYIFYILQFFIGLGAAMNLVNWRKLFAKNLDEGEEGLEYGVYDTVFSLCVYIWFSCKYGAVIF